MRIAAFCLWFLPWVLLAFSAASTARAETDAPDCDLRIHYGSYCCGIDRETSAAIEAYLQSSLYVESHQTIGEQGREGEYDVCVKTRSPEARVEAYNAIRALIPAYSKKAYTSISGAGLETHATGWPQD